MAYSYLSLTDFQSRIQASSPTTADNARHRAALEAASRQVDRYTARQFQPYTATHYYRAVSSLRLSVDDLLSITTLKTDNNNDGTFENTWDSNDYDLLPYNAPAKRIPYYGIEITDTGLGNQTFPTVKRGVEIAGVWGYWLDTEDTGATINEGAQYSASDTTLTVTNGALIEVLDTLLIESEQVYVTAKATHDLTVVRGVNGTTAAAHDDLTAISVYRYPEDVVEATFMQANRIQMMRAAPFGVLGGTDVGQVDVPRMHPAVREILEQFRPQLAWAI